ncbi:uncharacterized protein ATC70_001187 [Mucor velutinosus]|uniref:Uncharacterized protein n=1 Tax=Mucor velutinosus TaxID=708070 RepID=A0AAN7DKU2_9FUNG|nr:hypothetical protein ATC70_001187 [Mucor velutinosus]
MISARLELAAFCVLSRCDNRLHQETTFSFASPSLLLGQIFFREDKRSPELHVTVTEDLYNSTAPTFEFLPQTEVFKSTTPAAKSHDELDHPVSTEPSTDTTSLDPFTQDTLTDNPVTRSCKRKHSLTTTDSLPSKVIKMRNPKDKIPEKDILKKRITTTTTTPSSVKKSASGTSLLPKPTARNTATDKLQRTVEEANNNAGRSA